MSSLSWLCVTTRTCECDSLWLFSRGSGKINCPEFLSDNGMSEVEQNNAQGLIVKSANISSKCWVVRPGARYKFINQFVDDSFIAMGHLDAVELSQVDLDTLAAAEGEDVYSICSRLKSDLSINIRAQVVSFVSEMIEGDVVFTLSGGYIYPGVITSKVYIEELPLSKSETFQVRRKVVWGSRIDRNKIPVTLSKSFTAYQAIFSLGDNSKEIHHWLNSFFVSKDKFHTSLRVEQEGALSHHALKNLSEIMDRLQVLSLLIGREELPDLDEAQAGYSLDFLLSSMEVFAAEGLLNLNQQQLTMSPGDIWYELPTKCVRTGVAFLVGMGMLFGQSIAFADPALHAVCEEVTPLVSQCMAELQKDVKLDDVKKSLWVRVPLQNKKFVEESPESSDDFPEDGDPLYSIK
ncbi:hypothetical protein NLO74_21410 [Pseudomonas tremae]|uniref:hypothetical protein n=1 Tax=Pseudomonas syringae group TaxID=136849 RepID=UPI000F3E2D64|nr:MULTISPECIES: hypothetical protein [Pseudomonas syringae group]MCQ3028549.1 hypothetical protein [Pseudomonas tremae]RMS96582.1 hypothetical protein ALP56_01343 [Pseudomonas coronafaciens pv. oryzae]RMS98180.1 hypothetical protein ALP57_02073 [Pseudomonas coronafaciens pv. oryzae]